MPEAPKGSDLNADNAVGTQFKRLQVFEPLKRAVAEAPQIVVGE